MNRLHQELERLLDRVDRTRRHAEFIAADDEPAAEDVYERVVVGLDEIVLDLKHLIDFTLPGEQVNGGGKG